MSTIPTEQALSQPPEAVGEALLALPENQWFDRKSARVAPRDLANSLLSFANAEGGTIVVGLRGREVEGTDQDPDRTNAQLQANIDFCRPPVRAQHRFVECVNHDGDADKLLIFEIEPSEDVHVNQRDEVFLRVGDEDRRLRFAQRQELLYDKGQASYEARPLPDADLADLDAELLDGYATAVGAPDPMRLLRARGLATDAELTIAGCLLFAMHPQGVLPEAFIRVLRYRGSERGAGATQQLIEDVIIDGPIPRQLMEARNVVKRLRPARRALLDTGKFGDVPLVPDDAWLEGVVNAAVHRSYSMAGDHIRVEIFDDRIGVHSPGRFPGLVGLGDPLFATRFARNPRIARVCADLDFGQELGEGIRRMFEEMRQAGLNDPIYRQTSGSVQLTLLAEPVDKRLDAQLPEHARAITGALREAGRLSTGELTELLGISRPVLRQELTALEESGIVEWVGKSPRDPRAYWQLAPR